MQKKSVHNVAVVRLRLFSYTKAGGACILYPLRVSTVRKKSLERHCFCILILFLTSSAVVWLLYDFLIPLRQSGFLLQPGEEFKVFHVWLSVHQCVCFLVFPVTIDNFLWNRWERGRLTPRSRSFLRATTLLAVSVRGRCPYPWSYPWPQRWRAQRRLQSRWHGRILQTPARTSAAQTWSQSAGWCLQIILKQ